MMQDLFVSDVDFWMQAVKNWKKNHVKQSLQTT